MGRNGNCWDNAPGESFFSSLKNERAHGTRYGGTRDAAPADVFGYIEAFYNGVRRHTPINGLSPVTFYETLLEHQSVRQLA